MLIRNTVTIATILLLFTLSPELYSEEPRQYLPYSNSLKHQFTDNKDYDVFEGKITVTGTLFYLFDNADGERMERVVMAWFVPDEASISLLPNAADKPIDYITLWNAEAAFSSAFGEQGSKELRKSKKSTLKYYVTVTLRNFMVGEDCGGISYFSEYSVIIPDVARVVPENTEPPDGC